MVEAVRAIKTQSPRIYSGPRARWSEMGNPGFVGKTGKNPDFDAHE